MAKEQDSSTVDIGLQHRLRVQELRKRSRDAAVSYHLALKNVESQRDLRAALFARIFTELPDTSMYSVYTTLGIPSDSVERSEHTVREAHQQATAAMQ